MFSQMVPTATLPTRVGVVALASILSVGRVERAVHSNWPSKSCGSKSVKNPLGSLASRGSIVLGVLQTVHSINVGFWFPAGICCIAGK